MRSSLANWDAAHLVRGKEKKVDWAYQQNASKNSYALGPSRKQEGTTKGDMEEIRGARNEGSRVESGQNREAGTGQTTMVCHMLRKLANLGVRAVVR